MNEAGDVVSTVLDIESSGLTDEFEEFYFEEPIEGSSVRITLKGNTANAKNTIREVSRLLLVNNYSK